MESIFSKISRNYYNLGEKEIQIAIATHTAMVSGAASDPNRRNPYLDEDGNFSIERLREELIAILDMSRMPTFVMEFYSPPLQNEDEVDTFLNTMSEEFENFLEDIEQADIPFEMQTSQKLVAEMLEDAFQKFRDARGT